MFRISHGLAIFITLSSLTGIEPAALDANDCRMTLIADSGRVRDSGRPSSVNQGTPTQQAIDWLVNNIFDEKASDHKTVNSIDDQITLLALLREAEMTGKNVEILFGSDFSADKRTQIVQIRDGFFFSHSFLKDHARKLASIDSETIDARSRRNSVRKVDDEFEIVATKFELVRSEVRDKFAARLHLVVKSDQFLPLLEDVTTMIEFETENTVIKLQDFPNTKTIVGRIANGVDIRIESSLEKADLGSQLAGLLHVSLCRQSPSEQFEDFVRVSNSVSFLCEFSE